jgi:hypothetical protein
VQAASFPISEEEACLPLVRPSGDAPLWPLGSYGYSSTSATTHLRNACWVSVANAVVPFPLTARHQREGGLPPDTSCQHFPFRHSRLDWTYPLLSVVASVIDSSNECMYQFYTVTIGAGQSHTKSMFQQGGNMLPNRSEGIPIPAS